MRTALLLCIAFLLGPDASANLEPRATLSDACLARSNADACTRLGDLLESGALSARFPEEAGLYFALACENGRASSCQRAAPWARRYSDYEALETDVGCMLRENPFACEELASDLSEDPRSDEAHRALAAARFARALSSYLKRCERDDPTSCLGASRVYAAGFRVAPNLREAAALESRACALGLAAACEAAGDRRVLADALPFYRKACELPQGSPHVCFKLARSGEVIGEPAAVTFASYERACERLSTDACFWMSRHAEGAREAPAASTALRRFCAIGYAWACAQSQ